MENKPTFSERTRVVEGSILDIELRLEKLSDAFYATGNLKVANELLIMQSILLNNRTEIKAIDNEQSDAIFKRSCESSNNMINAALAAVGVKNESK